MRRNLWAGPRLVKRARLAQTPHLGPNRLGIWAAAAGASALLLGCGGAPPKPPEDDPYGAAIAECVDVPRGVSDSAAENMIQVPAGPALLGSSPRERAIAQHDYGRGGERLFTDEAPAHRATLPAFRMDRTPVTAQAYSEIVPACGVIPPDAEAMTEQVWAKLSRTFGLQADYALVSHFMWDGDRPAKGRGEHPMVLVTHTQAAFYCAWRGAKLPTAEQWERAARGPAGNNYPWGADFDPSRVNLDRGDTVEVGVIPSGNAPEGFTDMGGNVYEWTSTKVGANKRVVKGNGWNGRAGYGRGAAKRVLPAGMQDITLGFRCAI